MAHEKKRNWCFTINNPQEGWFEACFAVPSRYTVVGKEVGESGTPHLQGFIVFQNARTLSAVKNSLPGQAHLEFMRGTFKQAADYCKKEGNFVEHGILPADPEDKGDKEKKRWALALEEARTTGEVGDPQIAFVHARNVDYIHRQALNKRVLVDTETKHQWYWGGTGTGKSRKARTENPGAYLKMCNKWWDGYMGQEVVLIEDFDKKHDVLVHHMKLWADRYPFLAEVKGASCNIRPRLIIVTSNYHPRDIWTEESDLGPILRRFHVTEFIQPF